MMVSQVLTRRKWRLKAGEQHIVIVRGTRERFVHPLMKALLWALYLPRYPHMTVEIRIGDRYKPDVVAFAPDNVTFRENEPIFWGEAGQVGRDKLASILKRYPDTHFAFAKWDMRLKPYETLIRDALASVKRNAPVDLINFPENSVDAIDDDGIIHITFDDIDRLTL